MEPSNRHLQNTCLTARIRAALERILFRKAYPPDQPYMPQPGQSVDNPSFDLGSDLSETEADIQNLHGTSIAFGTRKTIKIDDLGRTAGLSQRPSYIVGSGRRVSNIEEVGGVCPFCQALAAQAFQEGKLTSEQAQLQSIFDIHSGVRCGICGILACAVHCRPLATLQVPVNICTACQKEIKKQERRKKIINFLLSPFIDSQETE